MRVRGLVMGRPVAVDLRDAGLGFAVRDGFAWLRDRDCAEGPDWAMQRFAEWLRAAGAENFRIDVDGNVITAGRPEPGRRWQVGIRHPWRTDRTCAVLSLADHAVATATNDGSDAELAALTVVAGDLAVAEATAATGLALGRAGIAWVDAQPGCLVYAVTEDGFTQHSAALTNLLTTNHP